MLCFLFYSALRFFGGRGQKEKKKFSKQKRLVSQRNRISPTHEPFNTTLGNFCSQTTWSTPAPAYCGSFIFASSFHDSCCRSSPLRKSITCFDESSRFRHCTLRQLVFMPCYTIAKVFFLCFGKIYTFFHKCYEQRRSHAP